MSRLRAGALTLDALRAAYAEPAAVQLSRADFARVRRSRAVIEGLIARGDTAYGVNTGFGSLASKRIPAADLAQLQHNLVLSHSAGTGAPLGDEVVRLVMVLKITSLAQGYSGVRASTLRALQAAARQRLGQGVDAKAQLEVEHHLADLHFGEVEDVVDQREQVLAG